MDYIRAICYDEAVYPDPHIYDPTRFLDKDGRIDPSVKAPEARIFGSGRRYEYVMITLITFLTVFNKNLPWTPFRPPDVTFHYRTHSCHVRHPPSCWRRRASEDSRSQVRQEHYSVSPQLRVWNRVDTKSCHRNPMPFKCVVKPRSEKAVKLIYDVIAIYQ